jgi:hypothetical protein
MRQLRLTGLAGIIATALVLAGVTGCGAPPYTYATDKADQAYFRVPSGWHQINAHQLSQAQQLVLGTSYAGNPGGQLIWSAAFTPATRPAVGALLFSARDPVAYASVQSLKPKLRGALSFNQMRDLLFFVTPQSRQAAQAAGRKLSPLAVIHSTTITTNDGIRGINELYALSINGMPYAFDQTVLTNSATTKLYLLLVQCDQSCFLAHKAQIQAVVNSFTVRGP